MGGGLVGTSVGGGEVGISVGGGTEVGMGAGVFDGLGGRVFVCAGVLGGFVRPPDPFVGVGLRAGITAAGVEVAVAVGVSLAAGVGVSTTSAQSPGPLIPRLYS